MPRRSLILLAILLATTLTAFWWSQEWLSVEWLISHRDELIEFCQTHLVLAAVA